MNLLSFGPINQIATPVSHVYAFKIIGHMDDDAAETLAKHMLLEFEKHDEKVNMLLDLTAFTGSDWDAMFDGDVIESRFKALTKVDRYAVVGAPDRAASLISIMNNLIPVEAKAFDAEDIDAAWAFVGAKPLAEAA